MVVPNDEAELNRYIEANPKQKDRVVLRRVYACGGAGGAENPTGANCTRNNVGGVFCSGAGACAVGCAWAEPLAGLENPRQWQRHHKLEHMCRTRMTVTWTVESVAASSCYVNLTGAHVDSPTTWVQRDAAATATDDGVNAATTNAIDATRPRRR